MFKLGACRYAVNSCAKQQHFSGHLLLHPEDLDVPLIAIPPAIEEVPRIRAISI